MEMDFDLEEIILYLNANEPNGKFCNNIKNLKNKLLKAQELEKVLEVIFEKPLSLLVLKLFERSGISDLEYEFFVEDYKATIEDINEDIKEEIVTEEEFELVKRWSEK